MIKRDLTRNEARNSSPISTSIQLALR